MDIRLTNFKFTNCGTGISVPAGTKIALDDGEFNTCAKAIEMRDPLSLFEALGLRGDIPPSQLVEILSTLDAHQNDSREAKADILAKSQLTTFLASGANLVKVIEGLIVIQNSGMMGRLLQFAKSL